MLKKIGRIFLLTGILAVYLNIGWAYGTYGHNHVFYNNPAAMTTFQRALAGPGHWVAPPYVNEPAPLASRSTLLDNQIRFSITGPFVLALTLISWLGYGIYCLGAYAFYAICWLLWLIFGGGIAKLLGAG